MDSCDHHHHQEVKKRVGETQQTPQLCANGCGFYGTKENKNLCSNCFKKDFLHKQERVEKTNQNQFSYFNNNNKLNEKDGTSDVDEKVFCSCCNKKIRGLMMFKCRCGGRFCTKHRYPEEHSCNFDFKNLGTLDLVKHNPVVKADKLEERIR